MSKKDVATVRAVVASSRMSSHASRIDSRSPSSPASSADARTPRSIPPCLAVSRLRSERELAWSMPAES